VQDYPWLQLDPDWLAEETKQDMLRQHWEQVPIARLDVKRGTGIGCIATSRDIGRVEGLEESSTHMGGC